MEKPPKKKILVVPKLRFDPDDRIPSFVHFENSKISKIEKPELLPNKENAESQNGQFH